MGECHLEGKKYMAGAIEVYSAGLKKNTVNHGVPNGDVNHQHKSSKAGFTNHTPLTAGNEKRETSSLHCGSRPGTAGIPNAGSGNNDGAKVGVDRPGMKSPNQNGGLYIGGGKIGGSTNSFHRRANSGPPMTGFSHNSDALDTSPQGYHGVGGPKSTRTLDGSLSATGNTTTSRGSPNNSLGNVGHGEASSNGGIPHGGSPISESGKGIKSPVTGNTLGNSGCTNNVRGIGNIIGSAGVNAVGNVKSGSTRALPMDNHVPTVASRGANSTPRNSGEFSTLGSAATASKGSSTARHSGEFSISGNGHSSSSTGSSPRNSGELNSSGNGVTKASTVSGNANAKTSPIGGNGNGKASTSPSTSMGTNNHGSVSSRGSSTQKVFCEGNINGRVNTGLNHGATVKGGRFTAVSPPRANTASNISNLGNLCKGNWNGAVSNGSTASNVKGNVGNILNSTNVGPGQVCANGNILSSGGLNNGLGSKGVGGKVDTLKNAVDADAEISNESILLKQGLCSRDSEEVKNTGNELYKKGFFSEALSLYERAISMSPGNAAYRGNKAAALTGLNRLAEAVQECEEAIKLDPSYARAHQRAASLYLRLGLLESSKRHLQAARQPGDLGEFQRIEKLKSHISKCIEMRKAANWGSVLRESNAAIKAGADSAPQVFGYKAEALLRLNRPEEADSVLAAAQKIESTLIKLGVTLADSFLFVVRAHVDMALGRFEEAVTAAESAARVDPRKVEVASLLRKARAVCRARSLGNDFFKAGKFFEACAAYGEGLESDPANAVLLCNRAACRSKLGQWEKAVEDCNAALSVQPNYTKALMRRANCNAKLERWEDALNDYEVLLREFPEDMDVARGLFEAQVALKKSRGEETFKRSFGGNVQEVSSNDQFREAVTFRGLVVVQFIARWNERCKQIFPFIDGLCKRHPSVNFIKVDVDENPFLAKNESVNFVPTFRFYKNGVKVEEIREPSQQTLEHAVQHYSL